jgi:hypothetical protein
MDFAKVFLFVCILNLAVGNVIRKKRQAGQADTAIAGGNISGN